MIFNTLEDDFQHKAPKSDYVEIKVIVPKDALEKAIQDALQTS